ncbi:MAG TPA: ABC transporter permease [Candidatus Omnitrophota bacterium]|nr:ABC transporter permease [Candidatus Omnitrophota bacterium]
MKIKKSFKISLNIIFHSKLRSWLTIIGIVIGIAAIVAIISLEQGATMTLENNLNSLGADVITITPGFSRASFAGTTFERGGGGFGGEGASAEASAKNLTLNNANALKGVENVEYVMGTISGSVDTISYLGQTSRGFVEGVDPALWKYFTNTPLASGRYLSEGDTGVVVIGGRVASSFSNIVVNQQITIEGRAFRIVGILQESGGSDDSRIFMSTDDATQVLTGKDAKDFDSILVKISDISQTDSIVTQITNQLLLAHGILQASAQDFSVTSLRTIQERISSTLDSASTLLTAIAVISLIVGAIGIMNTMFTSVLERTRDIGILKAIGAKNRDILTIFLFNAGIIGLIGGIFGIILGLIGAGFIAKLSGVSSAVGTGIRGLSSVYINPWMIIGIFMLSVGVGLIAGVIPAYRASKLNPVEALRYE